MPLILSDGGRSKTGLPSGEGDCVVRAICNLLPMLSYLDVRQACMDCNFYTAPTHDMLPQSRAVAGQRSIQYGVLVDGPYFQLMAELGFVRYDYFGATWGFDLPPLSYWADKPGRWVINLQNHATAVIDGVLVDAFDPRELASIRHGVYMAWKLREEGA